MYTPDPGVAGNGRLTALTSAAMLIALLVVLATTPAVGALLYPHVFIGVVIAGPLALKLASVGYRFARYYLGARAYIAKGPPRLLLRLLAPLLVAATIALMLTGFALLAVGPDDPGPFVGLHNVTFVLWLPLFAVHALAYTRRAAREALVDLRGAIDIVPGRLPRGIATGVTILAGCVLAVLLLPAAVPWTNGVLVQQLPGPVVAGTLFTLVALLAARPLRGS